MSQAGTGATGNEEEDRMSALNLINERAARMKCTVSDLKHNKELPANPILLEHLNILTVLNSTVVTSIPEER
jgi:hypothetical protein